MKQFLVTLYNGGIPTYQAVLTVAYVPDERHMPHWYLRAKRRAEERGMNMTIRELDSLGSIDRFLDQQAVVA